MQFKRLENTGNKIIFVDKDSSWKLWTYGPDEENHWNISYEDRDIDGDFETFDEAIQSIEERQFKR